MAKTVFVKSATKDRKVALSEAHEDHPGNHEAWVVGYPDLEDGSEDPTNVVEVGLTPLVRQKLANGELLEVDRPMARKQAAPAPVDDPVAVALGADTAERLSAAGFVTPEDISAASDEQLLEIEGVGQGTLRRIRASYPGAA